MKIMQFALLALPLTLLGCPDGGGTSTGIITDTDTDTDLVDTDTDTDDTDLFTTPTPPTPDPTYVEVVLADGDGVADTAGVVDADTMTITITNTFGATFTSGYGQTQVGTGAGWFGEDCLGTNSCNPIPMGDPVATLVLTRTGSANDASDPALDLMLLPVDPADATPSIAYHVIDEMDAMNCFVGAVLRNNDADPADDIAYYADLNCGPAIAPPPPAAM